MTRVRCRAVFLDAAGVIALPHRRLVRDALACAGVAIDTDAVAPAHYRAVHWLDRGFVADGRDPYLEALVLALGVRGPKAARAVEALVGLADRPGEILWSEAAPEALAAIDGLRRAGVAVVVVTNSDGHAAENLRDAGLYVGEIVDSGLVGSRKPDPEIFRIALARVGADAASTVHVGDAVAADVAGARAAGIVPIHVDPERACRATDHGHVRSLAGLSRHVDLAGVNGRSTRPA